LGEQAPRSTAPTQEGERIPALDLVRGVAILGILLANIPSFSHPSDLFGTRPAEATLSDRLVVGLTLFVIDNKFITLFSILFGAGLALQSERAQAAGRPFTGYYLRRLGLLFLVGLAHALLLWFGDILTAYAIVGFFALFLGRLGTRGVFRAMLVCFGWSYACLLLLSVAIPLAGEAELRGWVEEKRDPQVKKQSEALERPVPLLDLSKSAPPISPDSLDLYFSDRNQELIYRRGTFTDQVVNRAVCLFLFACQFWPAVGWYLLGCFLLGILLLRRGLFQEPDRHPVFIRRLILFGLGWGLLCHSAAVAVYWRYPDGAFSWFFNLWGALAQALGYLGLLLLWSRSGYAEWLQRRLRAVGRMALTNYLMQSLLCSLIFYNSGLALYGQVNRTQALLVVGGIWLLQLILSPIWLRVFTMGPVEWLWRCLAEGKSRPFLRRV
jgi:uncharacterized protein